MIDADLRRPSIHKTLGMGPKTGLSNVLTGSTTLQQAVVRSTIVPTLFILPAGTPPPNPAELLASSNMKDILAELREQYDHIIVDTPPTLSVTDAVVMSTRADAVVLVIRSGQTTKQALRRSRDLLMQVNAHIAGVLLNAVDLSSPDYYYYYEYQGKYGHSYYQEDEVPGVSGRTRFTDRVQRYIACRKPRPLLFSRKGRAVVPNSRIARMKMPLTSPASKVSLLLASVLLVCGYLWLAGSEFLASYFADRPDLVSLQRAVRWQPGNADYRHRLGRYFFLVQKSPRSRSAVLSRGCGFESASGPLLVRSSRGVSMARRSRPAEGGVGERLDRRPIHSRPGLGSRKLLPGAGRNR